MTVCRRILPCMAVPACQRVHFLAEITCMHASLLALPLQQQHALTHPQRRTDAEAMLAWVLAATDSEPAAVTAREAGADYVDNPTDGAGRSSDPSSSSILWQRQAPLLRKLALLTVNGKRWVGHGRSHHVKAIAWPTKQQMCLPVRALAGAVPYNPAMASLQCHLSGLVQRRCCSALRCAAPAAPAWRATCSPTPWRLLACHSTG